MTLDEKLAQLEEKFGLSEKKKKKVASSQTYTTGCIPLNIGHFNKTQGTVDNNNPTPTMDDPELETFLTSDAEGTQGEFCADCAGMGESLTEETKRYVKRYYIRPQNIFCSNKEEILKALIEIDDENCSVYSLKSLADHDDVHLLSTKDIIYYYDDGILYDKNHVKVMDYELGPKHEEERKKIADVDKISDAEFSDVYYDRLTDASDDTVIKVKQSTTEDFEEDFNPFNLSFFNKNAFGQRIVEGKAVDTCCICGEDLEGYGNNAEPYKKGYCCDACNIKFVIPERIKQMNINNE